MHNQAQDQAHNQAHNQASTCRALLRTAVVVGAAMMLLVAGTSEAALRYAFGNHGIITPSTTQDSYTLGPWTYSMNINDEAASAADPLVAGQSFTMPANTNLISSATLRTFPSFAIVAQRSQSFRTSQLFTETLAAGAGAAAAGPISFCPPLYVGPGNGDQPASGNLSCTNYAAAGSGNYTARIGIDQARTAGGTPTGNAFGGTLRLGRNITGAVWFALPPLLELGNTTGMQRVSRQPNSQTNLWTPGRTNYAFLASPNAKGPQYSAMLSNEPGPAQGAIASLTAGPFPADPPNRPPDIGWGFQMTTGVISGSDSYPPVGTVPYFYFVSTGQDTVTAMGEVRNLVLLSGSISTSAGGSSIVAFNRVQLLNLTLVPEPATAGALVAGALGLVALAGYRRR